MRSTTARAGSLISSLLLMLLVPAIGSAQFSLSVSVNTPPPELPFYEQPPIPGDGYLWTPGYWGWSDDVEDYYWVPGAWVEAPEPEYLWTPGYWGAEGSAFFWHPGYWGPHVGFYGGVNYGYGYGGQGYEGGYWQGGRLYYNRSVNNINNTRITNVYNRTVVNNYGDGRVSYNGGERGVRARPRPSDLQAQREAHIAVTPIQERHFQVARDTPELRASENRGHPPAAAINAVRATVQPNPGRESTAPREFNANRPSAGVESRRDNASRPEQQPMQRAQPMQRPEPIQRYQAPPRPEPAQRPEPPMRPQQIERPPQRPETMQPYQPPPRPEPVQRPEPAMRPPPVDRPAQRSEPQQRPAPRPADPRNDRDRN